MPLYDYQCETHGAFEKFCSMDDSRLPCPCPICGKAAARMIKAPHLAILNPIARNAMERNERSRVEPHVCHSHCNHHKKVDKTAKKDNQKPALQSYRGARPWVIEHA